MFKLSQRSLSKLEGVDNNLAAVVRGAIELTKVDFGVTEGLRSVERQKQLVADGNSQTMNSKHLEGRAVDLVAYVGPNISWELKLYGDICDAMKEAAIELGVAVKWGAAWSEGDIRSYPSSAQDAMNAYINLRKSQGRRYFIDAPHFELM